MSSPAVELYRQLHIGAENEVKGTKVFKVNTRTSTLVKFQYDEDIATSRDMVPGFAIPRVTLATEDPHGKDHSIIEHKTGPHVHSDPNAASYVALRKANDFLFKTLKKIKAGAFDVHKRDIEGAQCIPIEVILEDYNTTLRSQSDATLAPFELKEKPCGADCKWFAGQITDDLALGRQMNFEVPLRNVGDLRGGTEQVFDFASAFEDPNKRSLFRKCREKANARVVTQFQDDANIILSRTREKALEDPFSIKLQKLKSVMTLYYFYLCTEAKNYKRLCLQKIVTHGHAERSRHDEKNAFELLPKVAANDLIRSALSARDKELLLLTVLHPQKYGKFKAAMNSDLEECVGTLNGILIQEDTPHTIDECHDMLFVPGHGPRHYQGETPTRYGTDVIDPDSTFKGLTGTGKPLPVVLYEVSYRKHAEPVIVFEVRDTQHQFSKFGSIRGKEIRLLGDTLTEIHARIIKTQSAFPRGPKKH